MKKTQYMILLSVFVAMACHSRVNNNDTSQAKANDTQADNSSGSIGVYYLDQIEPVLDSDISPEPLTLAANDPATNVMTSSVAKSVDDAIQLNADNSMILDGATLILAGGSDTYQAGMVFRDINMPKYAQIISAHINFTAAQNNSGQTSLLLQGHGTHYTGVFKPKLDDIGFRARTKNQVTWSNLPAWTMDRVYITPDIANIIQETVDGPRWEAGNALAIIVSDIGSSTGTRNAVSYDGSEQNAPRLIVKWRRPK